MVVLYDPRVLNFISPRSGNQRTIVKLIIDGAPQLFYRSSGKNSGAPGVFFPFDGIVMVDNFPVWFNKRRFTCDPNEAWNKYPFGMLYRFGTQQMKDISDALHLINLPEGVPTSDGNRVNRLLTQCVSSNQLKPLNVDFC
jgi:hypothetical protein